MTRYLVVGASGCLGTALVEELNARALSFEIAGRSNPGNIANFRFLDLTNLSSFSDFPVQHYDQILYLAQSRKFRYYPEGIQDMLLVNFQAPRLLAQIARNFGVPFVYVSTGSVYKSKASAIKESDEFQPNGSLSLYQITKLAAEFEFREFENVKVIRPFFIYGKESDTSALIPTIVTKVIEGISIQLKGKTGLVLNPIHSMDAARAILHVTDKHHKVFNISGVEKTSIFELGQLIGNLLGIKPIFEVTDYQEHSILADIGLLIETGFIHRHTLQSGLNNYINSGVLP